MVLMIIINSVNFDMRAANLFVHNMSSFRGFRKIILGVIRKISSEAELNFKCYISD